MLMIIQIIIAIEYYSKLLNKSVKIITFAQHSLMVRWEKFEIKRLHLLGDVKYISSKPLIPVKGAILNLYEHLIHLE